jgi:AbiJ N-terminal domain 4
MTFSNRHGITATPAEITVRYDAPNELRDALISLAQSVGINQHRTREIICGVLLTAPNSNNWSAGNVLNECFELIYSAPWNRVYEIAEVLSADYNRQNGYPADDFYEHRLNEFFLEKGYGWKIQEGKIEVRGTIEFESAVKIASELLVSSGRVTAKTEIKEALQDLSKRPDPDLSGAVHHGVNALECLARDLTGLPSKSLGEISKNIAELKLVKPLDKALEGLWGYTSQYGRHIVEGNPPTYEDAELVVTLSSALITYLIKLDTRV